MKRRSERKGEHPEARRSMSSMHMPSPAIAHTAARLDCTVGRADSISNEKDLGARGARSLDSTLISMIRRPPSHLRFTTSNGNQRGEPLQGEQTQTQTQRNRTTAGYPRHRDGIVVAILTLPHAHVHVHVHVHVCSCDSCAWRDTFFTPVCLGLQCPEVRTLCHHWLCCTAHSRCAC